MPSDDETLAELAAILASKREQGVQPPAERPLGRDGRQATPEQIEEMTQAIRGMASGVLGPPHGHVSPVDTPGALPEVPFPPHLMDILQPAPLPFDVDAPPALSAPVTGPAPPAPAKAPAGPGDFATPEELTAAGAMPVPPTEEEILRERAEALRQPYAEGLPELDKADISPTNPGFAAMLGERRRAAEQAERWQAEIAHRKAVGPIGEQRPPKEAEEGEEQEGQRPGLLRRFMAGVTGPFRRGKQMYKGLAFQVAKIPAIVDLELDFRLRTGAYAADEVLPYTDHYGQERLNTSRLKHNISKEVLAGLPMMAPGAQELQRDWADWLSQQEELPPPKTLLEKFAQFGGDLTTFVAGMMLLKRPLKPVAGRVASGLGVSNAQAMSNALAGGFAAGGITLAETLDPQAALESAAFMTAVPMAGAAGQRAARAAMAPTRALAPAGEMWAGAIGAPAEIAGRFAGEAALFSTAATLQPHADWQDILVQGVGGPIIFNLPNLIGLGSFRRGVRAGAVGDFWYDNGTYWTKDPKGANVAASPKVSKLVNRLERFLGDYERAQEDGKPLGDLATELKPVIGAVDRMHADAMRHPERYKPADRKLLATWLKWAQERSYEVTEGQQAPGEPVRRAEAPVREPAEGIPGPEAPAPAGPKPRRPPGPGAPPGPRVRAPAERPAPPAEVTRPEREPVRPAETRQQREGRVKRQITRYKRRWQREFGSAAGIPDWLSALLKIYHYQGKRAQGRIYSRLEKMGAAPDEAGRLARLWVMPATPDQPVDPRWSAMLDTAKLSGDLPAPAQPRNDHEAFLWQWFADIWPEGYAGEYRDLIDARDEDARREVVQSGMAARGRAGEAITLIPRIEAIFTEELPRWQEQRPGPPVQPPERPPAARAPAPEEPPGPAVAAPPAPPAEPERPALRPGAQPAIPGLEEEERAQRARILTDLVEGAYALTLGQIEPEAAVAKFRDLDPTLDELTEDPFALQGRLRGLAREIQERWPETWGETRTRERAAGIPPQRPILPELDAQQQAYLSDTADRAVDDGPEVILEEIANLKGDPVWAPLVPHLRRLYREQVRAQQPTPDEIDRWERMTLPEIEEEWEERVTEEGYPARKVEKIEEIRDAKRTAQATGEISGQARPEGEAEGPGGVRPRDVGQGGEGEAEEGPPAIAARPPVARPPTPGVPSPASLPSLNASQRLLLDVLAKHIGSPVGARATRVEPMEQNAAIMLLENLDSNEAGQGPPLPEIVIDAFNLSGYYSSEGANRREHVLEDPATADWAAAGGAGPAAERPYRIEVVYNEVGGLDRINIRAMELGADRRWLVSGVVLADQVPDALRAALTVLTQMPAEGEGAPLGAPGEGILEVEEPTYEQQAPQAPEPPAPPTRRAGGEGAVGGRPGGAGPEARGGQPPAGVPGPPGGRLPGAERPPPGAEGPRDVGPAVPGGRPAIPGGEGAGGPVSIPGIRGGREGEVGAPARPGPGPAGGPAAAGPTSLAGPAPSPPTGGPDVRGVPEAPRSTGPDGKPGDFIITPAIAGTLFTERNQQAVARTNIEAIKLLKSIIAEERPATPEEQAVLVRYAGWGPARKAFQRYEEGWEEIYEEVKELLPSEEWMAANSSSTNAFYTPPSIIAAVYDQLARWGLKGGRMLEPGCGVGHWFGLMPPAMRQRTARVGVELDPTSGTIAKVLYPKSQVRVSDLARVEFPEGYFDFVIGNPPFDAVGVTDLDKPRFLTKAVHQYFLARGIEALKPGGVLAFVVTHGFLDRGDKSVRVWLNERANFLGAIRLNSASLPGTQVTTDLVFFQKLGAGVVPNGVRWMEHKKTMVAGSYQGANPEEKELNEWIVSHPDMVFGRYKSHSMAGQPGKHSIQVVGDPEGPTLAEFLDQAMAQLPEITMPAGGPSRPAPQQTIGEADRETPERAYVLKEGRVYVNDPVKGLIPIEHEYTRQNLKRLRWLIEVRDAARAVLTKQQERGDVVADLAIVQERLNQAYDRGLAGKLGPIHHHENFKLIAYHDPFSWALLESIERWDRPLRQASKGPIFTERLLSPDTKVEKVETLDDAIIVSQDETGGLDWERMAALSARPRLDLIEEALERGLVYELPGGGYAVHDEYLSGNVRAKLRNAEQAAKLDPGFNKNVEALRDVLPAQTPADKITAQWGAKWVPDDVWTQLFCSLFCRGEFQDYAEDVTVQWNAETRQYSVSYPAVLEGTEQGRTLYGTLDRHGPNIFSRLMNHKSLVVRTTTTDADGHQASRVNQASTTTVEHRARRMTDEMGRWLWSDPERSAHLADVYNEHYNNYVTRRYDGSYLTLPGMSRIWRQNMRERDYQERGVAHGLLHRGSLLLDVAVGGGKTVMGLAIALEKKRLRQAIKPLIVVHNSTYEQYRQAAGEIYPTANFLFLSKDETTGSKRRWAMGRIAAGDYDVAIIPQSTMTLIPMKPDTYQRLAHVMLLKFQAQIDRLRAAGEGQAANTVVTAMNRLREKIQHKVQQLQARAGKESIWWEDLGVDLLVYDESQALKNLMYITAHKAVGGMGTPTGSERAFDAWMKGLYMREQRGEPGGLVFMSGTPVENSAIELYTLMRFLIPDEIADLEIEHTDDFIATFAEISGELEAVLQGGYSNKVRLRRFANVRELMGLFRSFTEIVPKAEIDKFVHLPVLKKNAEGERTYDTVPVEASTEAKWVMRQVALTAKWIKANWRDAVERHMNYLQLTGVVRALAVDPRLVNPRLPAGGKIAAVVDRVAAIYQETTKAVERDHPTMPAGTKYTPLERGAQAIFLNLGIPSEAARKGEKRMSNFVVLDPLIEDLVARGVARNEIDHVWNYSKERMQLLFDKVNDGRVRVVIGSIDKMGTGVNMQARLAEIHMMDPPWKPAPLLQAIGRLVRSGNSYKEVSVHFYVTKGTGDEFMWSKATTKMGMIEQLNEDRIQTDTFEMGDEESESLRYAEIQAISSGRPEIKELAELEMEVGELANLYGTHLDEQRRYTWDVDNLERERIPYRERKIAELEGVIGAAEENPIQKELFGDEASWMKPMEVAELLVERAVAMPVAQKGEEPATLDVGRWEGFAIKLWRPGNSEPKTFDFREIFLVIPGVGRSATWLAPVEEMVKKGVRAEGDGPRAMWNRLQNLTQGAGIELEQHRKTLTEDRAKLAGIKPRLGRTFEQYDELQGKQGRLDQVREIVEQIEERASDAEVAHLDITDLYEMFDPEAQGFNAAEFERSLLPKPVHEPIYVGNPALYQGQARANLPRAYRLSNVKLRTENDGTWQAAYSPDQVKWLARRLRAGDPQFGMGAMGNIPEDVRTYAQRIYDAVRDYFYTRPAGWQRKVIDNVGHGVWNRKWRNEQHFRDFEKITGAKRLTRLDAEQVVDKLNRYTEARREIEPPEASWERIARAADSGDWKELTTEEAEILRDYRALWKAINDQFWQLPAEVRAQASTFGLRNIEEVMRHTEESGRTYMRRLYEPIAPRDYKFPKALRKEERLKGPRINPSMFRFRRSDYELWTVTLPDGGKMQFFDFDSAAEFRARMIEENEEYYGKSVYSRIKIIDPLDEDVVERLNPIKDIRVRMMRTLIDWSTNVQIFRTFDHLAKTCGKLDGELTVEQEKSGDWALLPTSPQLGPLSGLWVPEPVAYSLMETQTVRQGFTGGLFELYTYLWKASKVVYNPPTWFRQLYGLNFCWTLDGLHPITHWPVYVEAFKAMMKRDPRWRRMVSENEVTIGFGEKLTDDMVTMLESRKKPALHKMAGLIEQITRVTERTGRAYDFVDQWSKMASYLWKTERLGWDHRTAIDSLWMYPNYDRLGRWADLLRRSPFGAPFLAFTGEALKWNIRGLRDAPGRLFMMWMFPGIATALGLMMVGASDQEKKLLNRRRSYWQIVLPWRDQRGRLQTFDVEWIFPLASEFRVQTGPGGLGTTFMFSQPLMGLAVETLGGADLFSGKKLFERDDSVALKFRKWLAHAYHQLTPLPTMVTRGLPRLGKSVVDPEYQFSKTFLKEVLGLRIGAPYIRRNDVLKLARQYLSAGDVEALRELLDLWNEIYRGPKDPVTGRAVAQSVRGQRTRERRMQRRRGVRPQPVGQRRTPYTGQADEEIALRMEAIEALAKEPRDFSLEITP